MHKPLAHIGEAVGNTPVLELNRLMPRTSSRWYAKLEMANPGGSAKDRTAHEMVVAARSTGELRPGGTVVESSSGNLGMALARECALGGFRFVCVVDERANRAAVDTMRAFGATISLVTAADAVEGDLLRGRHARVRRLLDELPGAVTMNQYGNPANPLAHRRGTMRELAEALDGEIDVLLVATSTGGTISGCQSYLSDHGMSTRVVAVDAMGSVLFGGTRGPRLLPGMGAGLVTDLSRTVHPDEVIRVSEVECVVGARALAAREGLLAGASAGGVVVAAARMAAGLPNCARVAMILADGGTPYLPTIYNDDWVREQLGVTVEDVVSGIDSTFGPGPERGCE